MGLGRRRRDHLSGFPQGTTFCVVVRALCVDVSVRTGRPRRRADLPDRGRGGGVRTGNYR